MGCFWMSAKEYNKREFFQMAEAVRDEREMSVIFSFEAPAVRFDSNKQEKNIEEALARIGVSTKLKGWDYLRSAVRFCMEDREELDGITKRLYPVVAKKYRSSGDKVEHAIRHAIEVCWKQGNTENIQKILGYDVEAGKRPTNSEFISRLTDYIEEWEHPAYSMAE